MAMPTTQKHAQFSAAIPDRLYFKIGDVARICAVETYVLRFWETQFPQLKPNKSGTGQRLYRRRDVELALEIKQLVHGEGYTISGARQVIEQAGRLRTASSDSQARLPLSGEESNPKDRQVASTLDRARAELREIANLLSAPEPQQPRRRSRVSSLSSSSDDLFPS